jgi:hypothetical protein
MVATLLNFVVVGKGMVKIIERLEVPHSIDLLGMTQSQGLVKVNLSSSLGVRVKHVNLVESLFLRRLDT